MNNGKNSALSCCGRYRKVGVGSAVDEDLFGGPRQKAGSKSSTIKRTQEIVAQYRAVERHVGESTHVVTLKQYVPYNNTSPSLQERAHSQSDHKLDFLRAGQRIFTLTNRASYSKRISTLHLSLKNMPRMCF